ncbi:MAG: hypothetical protein HZA31_06945 [Opitutae bacterium]|nr:hypothetical protein [Opitutae bacterium]
MPPRVHRRFSAGVAFWAAAVLALTAAENSPPATTTSAAPDPIAEAKRQFEAVRGQRRDLPADGKLKLDLAVPAMPATESLPLPSAPSAKPDDAAKSGAKRDWLLDAMRRPEKRDERRSGRRGDDSTEHSGERDAREQSLSRRDPAGRDTRSASPLDAATSTPATPDPMRGYMASWLSPHDYALLVKPAKGSIGTSQETDRLSLRLPAADTPVELARPGVMPPVATNPDPANRSPRENPYLKSLPTSSNALAPRAGVAATLPAPVVLQKPPPAVAPPVAEIAEPPRPKPVSTLPPLLKPADDKKYFPQLKRF